MMGAFKSVRNNKISIFSMKANPTKCFRRKNHYLKSQANTLSKIKVKVRSL